MLFMKFGQLIEVIEVGTCPYLLLESEPGTMSKPLWTNLGVRDSPPSTEFNS